MDTIPPGSISIHALREEGDDEVRLIDGNALISIHALREEGDLLYDQGSDARPAISIHALREEGDPRIPS